MSDTFPITINNEEREIFMSFGLLNELTTIVQDPSRISTISLDPQLRNAFITSLLSERKKSGKVLNAFDLDDTEVSYEAVENAIAWAQEHVMSFFVRSYRQIARVTEKHQEEVTALTSSLGGSKGSSSKTPSSSRQAKDPAA